MDEVEAAQVVLLSFLMNVQVFVRRVPAVERRLLRKKIRRITEQVKASESIEALVPVHGMIHDLGNEVFKIRMKQQLHLA
jgi:hypothetical protein